jgi:hypothetical protein
LTVEPGKSIVEDTEKTLPGFPLASISNQCAAMKYTDTDRSLPFTEKKFRNAAQNFKQYLTNYVQVIEN